MSGLTTSLYQSTLTVEKIELSDGTASIYLTGSLLLGGECDDPRVRAQLEYTALQFPQVTKVKLFLNNQSLENYWGGK